MREDVYGVVEHLPDDFPADTAVTGPLHLDERGHAITIKEKVIEKPPIRTAGNFGHARFSPNEHVLQRVFGTRPRSLRLSAGGTTTWSP
jgi:hypothetical protein